jgi:haloacetate dehalogenase
MNEQFESVMLPGAGADIFATHGGSGPPLLLLHGFPETHVMWRAVATRLAEKFTVVCADLRGYGRSSCPPSTVDHSTYSKRAMAADMVAIMEHLGFRQFYVAGHDRGGRVAYRMALDHPDRILRLAVLDIVPTETQWERADADVALAFWPWSLLAQPAPLPERILVSAAEAIVDHALAQWGSSSTTFPTEVRRAYVHALQSEDHAHAICEEYRAAASIDREHDRADRAARRRIACPVFVMWSTGGGLARWFADTGGPIGVWQQWADDVQGRAIDAGHFFPEEAPQVTAKALEDFFAGSPRG